MDMDDIAWRPMGIGKVLHVVIYDDRPLTRWERFKAHIFRHRPDPRIIYSGPPEVRPAGNGEVIEVRWNTSDSEEAKT